MESFISYLTTEYKNNIQNFTAQETKFVHYTNTKTDKATNKTLKNDIIKVSLSFFDKNMNKLFSTNLTFENNKLNKSQAKKLINISYKELENKFMKAKQEICNNILNELIEKQKELKQKIEDINEYKGIQGIIPDEFKSESINIIETKQKYDM